MAVAVTADDEPEARGFMPYIPPLTRDWVSRNDLNRLRPNSSQRRNRVTLAVVARSWSLWSPAECAHDGMKRADDTGSGESASLSAKSGQLRT